MARSTRAQRPPLRHLDLDSLSESELEALLFDGTLPKKKRSQSSNSGSSVGRWMAAGAGAIVMLVLIGVTDGALITPLLIAGAVLFAVRSFATKSSVGTSACSWNWPSLPDRTEGRTLARSAADKKLMGVCGGLAAYLDADSTVVRLAFVLALVVTSGGPAVLAYLLLAYLLPSASALDPEERLRILRES
jgi:phage shock protein PspC (stress-responsive transcriptional regulator)